MLLSEFIRVKIQLQIRNFKKTSQKEFQRAGAVIAVLSTPIRAPKYTPMGNAIIFRCCLYESISMRPILGYASSMVTEWYAYNDKMLSFLGGIVNRDKISGFHLHRPQT